MIAVIFIQVPLLVNTQKSLQQLYDKKRLATFIYIKKTATALWLMKLLVLFLMVDKSLEPKIQMISSGVI